MGSSDQAWQGHRPSKHSRAISQEPQCLCHCKRHDCVCYCMRCVAAGEATGITTSFHKGKKAGMCFVSFSIQCKFTTRRLKASYKKGNPITHRLHSFLVKQCIKLSLLFKFKKFLSKETRQTALRHWLASFTSPGQIATGDNCFVDFTAIPHTEHACSNSGEEKPARSSICQDRHRKKDGN